ncbi:Hypothetical protein LUCI_4809 [Lucifera butyrica]|uniref:Uncharacterized protein n=1 Tax=Lucifera butyrica TaxID=1351585 RepID=A0A498RD84_9FIRM|nr:hypothetical protein [Lucifera butyrica]VBB09514.1 Hypothetical protein LUCI_4809 [Lucifera butyrica]
MKKTVISLLVCLALITLMGEVFADSPNVETTSNYSWNVTAAQRAGDYYKFEAPVPSFRQDTGCSDVTAAEKNGDYFKFEAAFDNGNVQETKIANDFWSITAAERNGDYAKFVANN